MSSKEQADKNLSLDVQERIIDEYAKRNNFATIEYFGGTYESAKTDGRKEFQRMLEFIKKNKGKVSHILVYTLDRFSRTGGGAIKLAQDLREKYGVAVFAVTQPTDTSNASGVFQQNIHLLFSEFDNKLRKQRDVAGMKEKFEKGIWCLRPPMGYDIIRINGLRKIVVNDTGKKIGKAFLWKAQGMKNEEIMKRLKTGGVSIYKQKLSMIFSNPFYCGVIVNKMLDGRMIEGEHEKIVSHDIFLKVNKVRAENGGKYGVSHSKEIEQLPLKVFMKCDDCGQGYTGYIVRAKNLWYYKCRTKDCCANKSAILVNKSFATFIDEYTITPGAITPLIFQMKYQFGKLNENYADEQKAIKSNLTELQKKIDSIDEDYYIKKVMPREKYENFLAKFSSEKQEIMRRLQKCLQELRTLKNYFLQQLQYPPNSLKYGLQVE